MKSASTREKVVALLPIAILVEGLKGVSWWRNFLHARCEWGLRELPKVFPNEEHSTLMPSGN